MSVEKDLLNLFSSDAKMAARSPDRPVYGPDNDPKFHISPFAGKINWNNMELWHVMRVHPRLGEADNGPYCVDMPPVAYFSDEADAKAFCAMKDAEHEY